MSIKTGGDIKGLSFFKKSYMSLFLWLCLGFITHPHALYGSVPSNTETYYMLIADIEQSLIEIATSNVSGGSSTISSSYLAGIAAIYSTDDEKVGTCSGSFLSMQNADGIYTAVSNVLSVDNGIIVSWSIPATLVNLELDSVIHSMVTECMVVASTKSGVNPFYGQSFDLVVSSDDEKIYFELTRTGMIF